MEIPDNLVSRTASDVGSRQEPCLELIVSTLNLLHAWHKSRFSAAYMVKGDHPRPGGGKLVNQRYAVVFFLSSCLGLFLCYSVTALRAQVASATINGSSYLEFLPLLGR